MDWEPVRGDHSIDRATASIMLKDAIDPNTFDEVVVAIRKAVTALNLIHRIDLDDAIELDGGSDQVIRIGPNNPLVRRVVFQRKETESATIVDEVSVGARRIIVATLRYRRWADFFALIRTAFDTVNSIHPFGTNLRNVELEFIDRFRSAIGGGDHFQVISRESGFLVRAVTDKAAALHVHTGWFDFEGDIRKLTNINIDAFDISIPLPKAEDMRRRRIAVRTMGRYEALEGGGALDNPLERLERLHGYLKRVFGGIITPEAAKRVGLND